MESIRGKSVVGLEVGAREGMVGEVLENSPLCWSCVEGGVGGAKRWICGRGDGVDEVVRVDDGLLVQSAQEGDGDGDGFWKARWR
jgi:hypothetical protein